MFPLLCFHTAISNVQVNTFVDESQITLFLQTIDVTKSLNKTNIQNYYVQCAKITPNSIQSNAITVILIYELTLFCFNIVL